VGSEYVRTIGRICQYVLLNADLTNKAESIMDLLVLNNVLKDDNWKILYDVHLRSVGLDRKDPRVEIWIRYDG
jgi:hypothetical protein